ncbi:hypothetical protein SDC9_150402 [bioreactor metagenome]|uniref:Hydrolase n=1 Tax=bioreactor metagenome TaxID=1076179 RepID=A0A645EMZ0_9ZZZZ|nr:hypothetical protein [Proteiniphilum sp.]MEA4918143.1 hypothetical protein [Proteiniphilum sp.]
MIIAIDFDGTIHTGVYPNIGSPASNAASVIRRLKVQGHCIIIWTCRECVYQQKMVEWLNKQGIPFDYINKNSPEIISEFQGDSRKIFADVYIDDRGITGLPSWERIYSIISLRSNRRRITNSGCRRMMTLTM